MFKRKLNPINIPERTDRKYINFINSYSITKFIGHNIKFDTKRVQYLADRFHGKDLTYIDEICTLKIAKDKISDIENHKLSTLCEYFKIDHEDSHTAIGDCSATLDLYKNLIQI